MGKIVKMRGLAQSALDRLRDRRKEMILKLTKSDIDLLDIFIRQQFRINPGMQQANLVNPQSGSPRHYQAATTDVAKELIALRKRWFEEKVLEKNKDGQFVQPELEEGAVKEVALAKRYVERLKEVVNHYAPCGMLLEFSERYLGLKATLEGKKLEDDLESIGDIMGEDGVKKEEKPAAAAAV